MKDWAAAEAELGELKRAGFGDAGQVEFYLAQVSEERGRLDEAIARYKDVPEGERGWLAKLRIAAVMGKQGKRAGGAPLARRPSRGHDRAARAGAADRGAAVSATRTTTRRRLASSSRA